MQEKPELLIMDEPSEGLDPLTRNVLYEYLLRFKEDGITIFFSSHNLAEVEKISDHVGLVKEGQFIALEPNAELKKKMVRKMEIDFFDDIDIKDFILPSLKLISQDIKRLVFQVRGEVDPLLKHLSKFRIKNLVFPEPSLEDMFMTFYQDKGV
jgi:ABC-2 type transport system ATP-binding protein